MRIDLVESIIAAYDVELLADFVYSFLPDVETVMKHAAAYFCSFTKFHLCDWFLLRLDSMLEPLMKHRRSWMELMLTSLLSSAVRISTGSIKADHCAIPDSFGCLVSVHVCFPC
jgi:hypothetical protein